MWWVILSRIGWKCIFGWSSFKMETQLRGNNGERHQRVIDKEKWAVYYVGHRHNQLCSSCHFDVYRTVVWLWHRHNTCYRTLRNVETSKIQGVYATCCGILKPKNQFFFQSPARTKPITPAAGNHSNYNGFYATLGCVTGFGRFWGKTESGGTACPWGRGLLGSWEESILGGLLFWSKLSSFFLLLPTNLKEGGWKTTRSCQRATKALEIMSSWNSKRN